ncbi:MAG: phosphatidate cytidylyltransferase [Akkermansiaceae bacterium]|nr:phosphatidate cytidylyltransferase [Akkermansiaceae bacterium]
MSTLLMWAVVMGAFFSGELWPVVALVGVLAALGSIEFSRLTAGVPGKDCRWWALAVSLLYLAAVGWRIATGHEGGGMVHDEFFLEVAGLVVVVLGAFTLRLRHAISGPESVLPIALALLAFVYVPVLFGGFTMRLAVLPVDLGTERSGIWLLLLVVIVTKFTDMGAYLVGSLIGKHKAIPHISPAKSWEGYGGSILFALGGALGIYFLGRQHFDWMGSMGHVVALGIVIAVAAMVGDLAESILKRSLRVKDSGRLLPGIGGVLDLIDSVCFSAPVVLLYLVFFVI